MSAPVVRAAGGATAAERANLDRRLAAARTSSAPQPSPATPAPAAAPPKPAASAPAPPSQRRGRISDAADQGAGFILGILLWGWVILPLIQGGPTQVRNVWRAKFLNRGPDGQWLP
jgi:hypothetical protein